ncbi:MAG: (2Fe-2S)-binding protein [Desulfobacterales bacterium]|jgi:aerobic-type carbon monoxide dehydrogenase small subunit (CoxS/CutS family)
MTDRKEHERETIRLTINDGVQEFEIGDHAFQVTPYETLAQTLRETLGLMGTKTGCNQGACGSCTVLMDGIPVLACMLLTIECDGKQITTIEGLQDQTTGKLDEIQQAFIDHSAFQCGFCTPGIIMASKALLSKNPSPTEAEIKQALSGHYCRCISHYHVVAALLTLAGKSRK